MSTPSTHLRAIELARRAKQDAADRLDRAEMEVTRAQAILAAARAERAQARARHQAAVLRYLDLVEATEDRRASA